MVRRNALSRGPQGAAWLRDLGQIVAKLAGEWGLQVGRSLSGGTESFVEARTAAGEDAVLKIALPGREPEDAEARILIAAGGRGYVRAFRYDERRRALLLERLGPHHGLGLPADEQNAVRGFNPRDPPDARRGLEDAGRTGDAHFRSGEGIIRACPRIKSEGRETLPP